MKRTIKTATITIAVLLVIATVLTAGFFLLKKPFTRGDSGTFILSVNPEIRIDYDQNGVVTSVAGNNRDGEALLAGLDSYVGLSCAETIKALVSEIYAAGYFVDDIDGEKRNIVIQIEPGSVIPEKNFVENIKNEVAVTVQDLAVSSEVITIDESDYDEKYANAISSSKYITLDKAKEIALAHAGVEAADAKFDDREFDLDDGKAVYELEFYANGGEYEYDIDATSGKILDYEWDIKKQNGSSNSDAGKTENSDNPAPSVPEAPVTPVVPETPVAPVVPETPAEPAYITLDEAKAIALADAGISEADAKFDDREFDLDDGKAVYELEFYANGTEYEYDIDALDGSIVRKEINDKKTAVPETPVAPVVPETPVTPEAPAEPAYITLDEAKAIALADAGVSEADAKFDDRELDTDDGKAVYEISFEVGIYEYEYDIDAENGNILDKEKDIDD